MISLTPEYFFTTDMLMDSCSDYTYYDQSMGVVHIEVDLNDSDYQSLSELISSMIEIITNVDPPKVIPLVNSREDLQDLCNSFFYYLNLQILYIYI